MPWHAERPPGASDRANEVGHAIKTADHGSARVPGWLGECLRLGVGHASTVRPDPSTLGVVGERGSHHEDCSQSASGAGASCATSRAEVTYNERVSTAPSLCNRGGRSKSDRRRGVGNAVASGNAGRGSAGQVWLKSRFCGRRGRCCSRPVTGVSLLTSSTRRSRSGERHQAARRSHCWPRPRRQQQDPGPLDLYGWRVGGSRPAAEGGQVLGCDWKGGGGLRHAGMLSLPPPRPSNQLRYEPLKESAVLSHGSGRRFETCHASHRFRRCAA
jgi:hypothetical protein